MTPFPSPSFVIPHPASAIRHLSSAIRHLSSVIRHLSSAICHLPFLLPHSSFRIPHSAFSSGRGHPLRGTRETWVAPIAPFPCTQIRKEPHNSPHGLQKSPRMKRPLIRLRTNGRNQPPFFEHCLRAQWHQPCSSSIGPGLPTAYMNRPGIQRRLIRSDRPSKTR